MPPAKTVLAALGAMAALAAPAAAAPPGTTSLVDRPAGFGALPFDGNNETEVGPHALSRDERFVAVVSDADALSSLDENSADHIFRIDRVTGRSEQVDTTAQGGQPALGARSGEASISADGRFVAFTSNAGNLVAGAPLGGLFVKDMRTGAIVLAGRATGADGAPAPLILHAVISGDGRHVAFTTFGALHALNADGVAGETDAYVRDLDVDTTRMASVSNQGAEAGGVTGAPPDIDFGGDAVAFVTTTKLDGDDGVNDRDAYVRTEINTAAPKTRLASIFTNQVSGHATTAIEVALSGSAGDLRVAWTAIETYMTSMTAGVAVPPAKRLDVARPGGTDAGGTELPVFEPVGSSGERSARLDFIDSGALDPADTNGRPDAYAAPVAAPGSPATLLTSGKSAADVETVGASGATVAFTSLGGDLPGGDGDHEQAYVRGGGRDVNLVGRASDAGPARIDPHAVSDDGGRIVFTTQAPALGSLLFDEAHLDEVEVRDTASGATTLLSAAPGGDAGDDDSNGASIDAAGDRVAFASLATNVSPGDNPRRTRHAFVRDVGGARARLIDRTADGVPLAGGISRVEISADGRHAVYVSDSPDAPGAPAGGLDHAYLVDLGTGDTVLVDRATGGTPSNGLVHDVDVSGDGSRVAFTSDATNLGASFVQAYVRDLRPGAVKTTWVSVPTSGAAQDSEVGAVSIDRAGARVAFEQSKPGFGFGMTAVPQVFVRDVAGATPDLASRGPDDPANAEAIGPSLSADGRRLTFVTAASNFPAAAGRKQVYLRNLVARSTTPVSGRARLGAETASLSGSGACVAFRSSSDDLVTPSYGPDFSHVFLRAVSADCPPPRPTTAGTGDAAAGGGGTTDATGATGAGGATGPSTTARDTTPPRISRARLTRRRFAVAGLRTAVAARARRGTSIAFTLSEDARTTIAITRKRRGRTVTLLTLRRARTHAGVNRVAFSGRTKRTRLKPGAYRARLSAQDRARNRSKPVSLTFRVVRR